MFSFFKSKKPSPTQSGEPIPGAIPAPPREEDFIFIERRDSAPKGPQVAAAGEQSATSHGGSGLYPSVPGTPSGSTSGIATAARQRSEEKLGHALQDVPFRLSPDLSQAMDTELTRIQVDEIMSFIGRTMYAPEYDFSLERGVLDD